MENPFYTPETPDQSPSRKTKGRRGGGRLFNSPRPRMTASVLMASWFVPDIWSFPPRFPLHQIETLSGTALIPHLVWPITGALLLVVALSPMGARLRWWLYVSIGLAAIAMPTLFQHPGLPIGRAPAFTAAIGGTALALLGFKLLPTRALGAVIVAAFPATLLITVLYGVAVGAYAAQYLWSFKAPICLYAAMSLTATSAAQLLHSPE